MCGLAAIFSYRGRKHHSANKEIVLIRDRMRRRGPDGEGVYFDDHINLAHTRLSIVDLTDAAAQPMKCIENGTVIVFNGEIYNFRELRKRLEKEGYVFQSNGDTEVLLKLYDYRGDRMVEDLRGMYAFAIWDPASSSLFCARDPLGIKPLYYSDDGKTLRIASQVMALQAGGVVSADLDPAGISGFCLFGNVPEPYTCCRHISALPAGNILSCKLGEQPEIRPFFSISRFYDNDGGNGNVQLDEREFFAALRESVFCHMTADVPVGIYLSSGIDSGALLGLMRDASQERVDAMTLCFEEYLGRETDEGPVASLTARHYQANHVPYVVGKRQLHELLFEFVTDMDQPSVDGLNTWLISYAARQHGLKVMISGIGGDELAGGYPSFRDIPRWTAVFSGFRRIPRIGGLFSGFVQFMLSLGLPVNPKVGGLFTYGGTYAGAYFLRRGLFMPWELRDLIGDELAHEGLSTLSPLSHLERAIDPCPGTPYGRIAALESTFYLRNQLLRDADWAGMANSVEIRTPFVDAALLKTLAPFIARHFKSGCKHLLADAPSKPLPDAVRKRRKTGFTVPVASLLEKHPLLQAWRRIPILRRPECHWARRWAYSVICPVLQST